MVYALNKDVYLVKGSVRSCIYDFNSLKLYTIANPLAEKIDIVNHGGIIVGSISNDEELETVFDQFIRLGILTLSETPITHEIYELKAPDLGCSFAWIEITNRCNLRCRHCYNDSDPYCETAMALRDYEKVIDNLLALEVQKVQIIGGEPFFDKKLLKNMLDYTIGKFKVIEIFTNGTLITPSWVDYLASNNIHIALSVYSYDSSIHDGVTGVNGSWERANQAIKTLKQYGVVYRVCNVLMKDVPLGGRNTKLYNLSYDKDIVRMAGRANFKLLSDDLIRKQLITKKSFQGPLQKHLCSSLVAGHNCFRNRLYVSADMTVYPCVMERRLKHCKIGGDGGIILDDRIRSFNKDKIEECSQCEFRYLCFDCRPNSLSGKLKEKPWYCTYQPLLGTWEDEDSFIENLKAQWG